MSDEAFGVQAMFRRKKHESVEGEVCPYCEFVNPVGATNCAQCYYVMDKAARDQPMATPTSSGSELMQTLLGDDDFEEEEELAVEAVLSMDEVTVEIGQNQLGDAGDEDALGFIKAGNPTLSETVEYESPQAVELEASDAPTTPVDFQIEAHDPMAEVAEPVHTGLGNLYSPMIKTESDDDLTGSVGPAPGTLTSTPDLQTYQVKRLTRPWLYRLHRPSHLHLNPLLFPLQRPSYPTQWILLHLLMLRLPKFLTSLKQPLNSL